jgi:hypothetical protein
MSGFTDTIEGTKPDTIPKNWEPGDHDKFAHFVPKTLLGDALVNGTPVTALCGHVFVPFRNPDDFPTCPACVEEFEALPPE